MKLVHNSWCVCLPEVDVGVDRERVAWTGSGLVERCATVSRLGETSQRGCPQATDINRKDRMMSLAGCPVSGNLNLDLLGPAAHKTDWSNPHHTVTSPETGAKHSGPLANACRHGAWLRLVQVC